MKIPTDIITPIIIAYFAVISLVAIVVTILDKRRAKVHAWRIPERTLLLISALGGSVAMLITMQIIRHKTKHIKFMLGIPAIVLLQLTAAYFILKGFPLLP